MVSAGRILILPKGEWNNLTSYSMLDLVTATNGVAYLARQASVGVNPMTDSANTYWQPFGSTVIPDDETIIADGNNNIAVNIDGETLRYDQTSGKVVVKIDGNTIKYDSTVGQIYVDMTIADLSNINISSVKDGQALIYNSTSSKWENADVSTTLSGLTDTQISNPADGNVLKYNSTSGKWENAKEQGGGAGIVLAEPTRVTISGGDMSVNIKWTDPNDVIYDGATLATWAGTAVVRKIGSAPKSINDGTLVINSITRNAYQSTAYTDSGLTNGVTYYYGIFPYSIEGTYNYNYTQSVIPKAYTLLGFKIKKSETNPASKIEYTEGAVGLTPGKVDLATGKFDYGDFANFWFVTENKPVMLKYDGTEDYELDPNDYTKRADGTASDVSNSSYGGNVMARIPKVYLKMWEDSEYEYCNISDTKLDDTYTADAYIRADGTEGDYFYMAAFECALVSNKLRSIKGLTPMVSKTRTEELTYAKANGSAYSTWSYSRWNTINMLLYLIGKNTDVQETFGYGYHTGGSSSSPNYLTTGGASDKGQFYGTSQNRDYVKVFHIECYWGDIWKAIEGFVTDSNVHIKIKTTPGYNTTGSGYIDTNIVPGGTSGGYISACKMTQYGLIPTTASGSETTQYPDGLWFAKDCYAVVGGHSNDGRLDGLAVHVRGAVSSARWTFGASLSAEQPNAA